MRNYSRFNNLFNRDRKVLYIVLSIVMISVFTLTVVYAALSTTLQINGNAEISAASWDIYLDNVQVTSGSVSGTNPSITSPTTATFSTKLEVPGDFYEFTIDVVNNGSIDAMVDGVTKTPTLTETQAKYLNYIVEYQNGELINNKQLVSKNSFVRLKVKLEFRKDITASDLLTTSETLNLSFSVNYVQADTTGTNVTDNGVKKAYEVITGDLNTVGSEVAIGDEHFYIISSDEDSVAMLAKYNLYVGGKYENSTWVEYGEEATGKQDSTMIGYPSDKSYPRNGTISFSSTNYWYDGTKLKSEYGTSYPVYVYDNNSAIYDYVENYKIFLESQGAEIEEARLIKKEELNKLGCVGENSSYTCLSALKWVYDTSYWTGSAYNSTGILAVNTIGGFGSNSCSYNVDLGVRPVIVIKI